MYTIRLSDGTKLDNLRLNGNNFIANYRLTDEDFKHKLDSIYIESDSEEAEEIPAGYELGHHKDMQLMNIQHGLPYMEPNEYWFVLAKISEDQKRYDQIRADIEYLAMMTDTEL